MFETVEFTISKTPASYLFLSQLLVQSEPVGDLDLFHHQMSVKAVQSWPISTFEFCYQMVFVALCGDQIDAVSGIGEGVEQAEQERLHLGQFRPLLSQQDGIHSRNDLKRLRIVSHVFSFQLLLYKVESVRESVCRYQ